MTICIRLTGDIVKIQIPWSQSRLPELEFLGVGSRNPQLLSLVPMYVLTLSCYFPSIEVWFSSLILSLSKTLHIFPWCLRKMEAQWKDEGKELIWGQMTSNVW